MSNSIDFDKGIFLHVIPVRVIVPWHECAVQSKEQEQRDERDTACC